MHKCNKQIICIDITLKSDRTIHSIEHEEDMFTGRAHDLIRNGSLPPEMLKAGKRSLQVYEMHNAVTAVKSGLCTPEVKQIKERQIYHELPSFTYN